MERVNTAPCPPTPHGSEPRGSAAKCHYRVRAPRRGCCAVCAALPLLQDFFVWFYFPRKKQRRMSTGDDDSVETKVCVTCSTDSERELLLRFSVWTLLNADSGLCAASSPSSSAPGSTQPVHRAPRHRLLSGPRHGCVQEPTFGNFRGRGARRVLGLPEHPAEVPHQ